MPIDISIFYLRPYIISHNSQCGYIIGTLKYKFGLKLQRRVGKNGLRLIIDFEHKRSTELLPEIDCDQTAIGLSLVTSAGNVYNFGKM
jgi:hypothetical protein